MIKNYFCHDIHSTLNIRWSAQGWKVSPCCLIGTKPIDVNNKNWFTELWPELRKDNLNNKPLNYNLCKACIDDESVGKQSRRLGEIIKRGNKIKKQQSRIKYLEIHLDLTCNKACMICKPEASSLWRKYTTEETKKYYNAAPATIDIENLLKNIDLTELDSVQICGGEPLLTETHIELLLSLEKKGCDLSKLELWYHTNGSCRVEKTVLDLWKKFRLVILYFSIDDIDKGFEYQRYPGNWLQLIENINWFNKEVSSNILLRVERTISLLNAHRLLELEKWEKENNNLINFDYFNTHMSMQTVLKIENISKKHLDFLKKDKKNYETLSKFYPIDQLIINEEAKIKVMEFVKDQDQKRNILISSYFPEFYSLYQ
jgi:hypothetical protein